ncbi:hypothetical protein [Solimicrobium silvestre]|uniref:hypothetical protein n=1 Tax=Solimicrobium silvestre TaxID=2099400 RepID=UPI001056FE28|nr:hypothetical protein [Solimicrobium silvestre]
MLIGIYIGCLDVPSILIRSFLAVLCGLAAYRIFFQHQKNAKKIWHIAIDGKGQLRCLPVSSSAITPTNREFFESNPFYLMSGTTLWARVLFLRLHCLEDDVMINLVILSDALSRDEFRRLSVACKWIVAHAESPTS